MPDFDLESLFVGTFRVGLVIKRFVGLDLSLNRLVSNLNLDIDS